MVGRATDIQAEQESGTVAMGEGPASNLKSCRDSLNECTDKRRKSKCVNSKIKVNKNKSKSKSKKTVLKRSHSFTFHEREPYT